MPEKPYKVDIDVNEAGRVVIRTPDRTEEVAGHIHHPIHHPGWNESDGAVERELKRLDAVWDQAVLEGDVATLDRLMADDYSSIGPFGDVNTKEQELKNITAGGFTYEYLNTDDLNVRVYGETGVLTGRLTIKGVSHGQPIAGQYRYTDVYVKRRGNWQVVSFQATPIIHMV